MAYTRGDLCTAAVLTDMINNVNQVWGTGNGDYGYGQTLNVTAPSQGDLVEASIFQGLRDTIEAALVHQGQATTALPPLTLLEVGDENIAYEPSHPDHDYDFPGLITAIQTNRLVADAGNMSLVSGVYVDEADADWSEVLTFTFAATFASEDAARYFFNSGGEVRVTMDQPTGSSTQDVEWADITQNKVGTLALSSNGFSSTGSVSGSSNIGFYGLTTSDQLLFDGSNIGSGAYTANDVLVYGRVDNVTGTNGGNGTKVIFTVTLADEQTNIYSDVITAGTQVSVDLYASSSLTITSPTVALESPTIET